MCLVAELVAERIGVRLLQGVVNVAVGLQPISVAAQLLGLENVMLQSSNVVSGNH